MWPLEDTEVHVLRKMRKTEITCSLRLRALSERAAEHNLSSPSPRTRGSSIPSTTSFACFGIGSPMSKNSPCPITEDTRTGSGWVDTRLHTCGRHKCGVTFCFVRATCRLLSYSSSSRTSHIPQQMVKLKSKHPLTTTPTVQNDLQPMESEESPCEPQGIRAERERLHLPRRGGRRSLFIYLCTRYANPSTSATRA